jgi:hypothetical protein
MLFLPNAIHLYIIKINLFSNLGELIKKYCSIKMQILNAENTFNTGIFQYNNREKVKTRAIEDRTHSILVPFTAIIGKQ